ncbi:hypothetical protein [Mitsuokella multacida]|jgi:hypothetical protein|uniref:DUF3887 domain-containing protein n=1 Tax=Mitsuokella multacida TaxID=52226 RepID=A0A414NWQ7_9FIRM|nr:hypothetical protein [Mitsuokella multacida]RHF51570.1 hypothetical protein DW674_07355 [Mitsuokella multacida]
MKKIYLLAMMLCLLILPATAMAAPSANATAFANEEALSNQWIDSMLVKKDSSAALNIMSADAKKNVKASEMQKAQERMSKELGTLKESRFVSWTRFDKTDQVIYLMSFDKAKVVRCEFIFNSKGELDYFALTPFAPQENAKNAKAKK